ncbi:retrovirus-related pol polyprotein from transposon TNT 1-94 [Tanacetum coccineum]
MANLEFCDKHNMVAYLKKPTGSEGFQEIVDFLNGSHIRFALTKNPTIYVSLIEKFWQTATVRTVDNGEQEITATVDGKEFTITEASVRRHLQLADVEGISALPTTEIFDQLSLMGNMKRGFSEEHTPLFPRMLAIQAEQGEGSGHPSKPQPPPSNAQPTYEEPIPHVTIVPIPNVKDEAVYEEWDDRVERATTTAASLDAAQASGNITKTQSTAIPNVPFPQGIGAGGSPRCQEATGGSIAQTRSKRVPTQPHDSPLPRVNTLRSDEATLETDLRQTKKVYGAAYTKLIMKVKKLEKIVKSNQARRRAKIVVSDDEEDLEDSSKQGRMIEEIDQDAGITLVTPTKDTKNVHTYTRRRRAVSTGSSRVSTASRLFSTAEESVSTAGIVQEVNISIPSSVVIKDKAAVRLQEELHEEERQRMARVHAAAQSFTKEEWENIRARVEADEELTQRLQAEERNKYSEVDQAKMLVDLINQRKRYFVAHKAEAKRNKPMIQAQQRNYMMNYIKHMGSHTLQQLKIYSFNELKELFETTMKNVNTFIPMETEDRGRASELAAGSSQATITDSAEVGSSKRGAEVGLDHEGSKKQKTNEASELVQEHPDEEEKELPQEDLQQMMMVVPVEEVYVEALQVKYPIIDWEIFYDRLKKFDKDDLVKLWDLVKERFITIEPTDDKEKELWVELKRLFKPNNDDTLLKLQSYMHDPLVWRLYDTCGVYHVSLVRGHDIFMLVEKDYPLSKGVQMLMLGNKLWFNLEKLVDLDDNHKFRGGLLGFKPITLSTAKRRVYTARVEDSTARINAASTKWIKKESLNVTFDETHPSSKTSPLVDDDLDEEEAIKVTKKKNLENDIEDETLKIDEIVNIKESRNHPLENNVNEALTDNSWIVAMQEELNQFIANDVWELVPQPRNMTIIGTKWVFRNKLDENGIVSRNKARLVAQGYNQQEGIDYDETYAPVARLESIRILLAYACALDFKLFQMDVKSAFLNGFINEEVYVAQPPGFIDFEKPDHVYKLKKALYGLKQAPKAWYDRLKAFPINHEYKIGMVDNTLFTKKKSSNLIIVQIYVDDIIFCSTCQDMCDEFSKIMHDEFEMSMMGELNFFLGLQIKQMEDEAPKTSHLEAVKHIFRYIKGTMHLGLWYPKGTRIETVVYADSDHATTSLKFLRNPLNVNRLTVYVLV